MAFDSARVCAVLFGGVSSPRRAELPRTICWETRGRAGLRTACPGDRADDQPRDRRGRRRDTIEADLSQRAPAGGAVVIVTAAGAAGVPNVDVPGGATSATATYLVPADTPPGDVTLTGQLAGIPDGERSTSPAGAARDDGRADDHPVDDSEQLPGSEPRLPGRPHLPRISGRRHRGSQTSGRRHRHGPDSPRLDIRADGIRSPGAPWRIPVRRTLGSQTSSRRSRRAQPTRPLRQTPQSIARDLWGRERVVGGGPAAEASF